MNTGILFHCLFIYPQDDPINMSWEACIGNVQTFYGMFIIWIDWLLTLTLWYPVSWLGKSLTLKQDTRLVRKCILYMNFEMNIRWMFQGEKGRENDHSLIISSKVSLSSKKFYSSMKRLHSSALLSDDPATGKLPSSNMRFFCLSRILIYHICFLKLTCFFGEHLNQLMKGIFQPKSLSHW